MGTSHTGRFPSSGIPWYGTDSSKRSGAPGRNADRALRGSTVRPAMITDPCGWADGSPTSMAQLSTWREKASPGLQVSKPGEGPRAPDSTCRSQTLTSCPCGDVTLWKLTNLAGSIFVGDRTASERPYPSHAIPGMMLTSTLPEG